MEKEVYVVQEGMYWGKIQEVASNAVVQVFAQIQQFNWTEPYRAGMRYENRGSGFFVDEKGHIVTNAHVVAQAKYLWVQIPALGQKNLRVEIVGTCPDRDLALLRMSEDDIALVRQVINGVPYLEFGDSDNVQRTDSVLTLGYPLGQHRLKGTTGVVSGRESLYGRALLQITAPVNPGSSGGPLLNVSGEVIGITIAAAAKVYNVGYAIAVNELRMIFKDLHKKRLVYKPVLGAQFVFSSDAKVPFLKNPSPGGVYISTVFKGSLFDKAGVRSGDMLYEFAGLKIDSYGDTDVPWSRDKMSLYELVSRIVVDDTLSMVIFRDGERIEVQFTVTLDYPFAIRPRYPDAQRIDYEVIGGLVLMELTDNHIEELVKQRPDILFYAKPENKMKPVVVVTHLLPGSYAYQTRIIRAGDIISSVNGVAVETIDQCREAILKEAPTGFLAFTTREHVLVVFELDRLIAEEEQLSKDLMYPISQTVDRLGQVVKRG